MGQSLIWTPWHGLPEAGRWNPDGLRETLLGGQAFRWNEMADGRFSGIFNRHLVECRLASPGDGDNGSLEWRALTVPGAPDPTADISSYFGADIDWSARMDRLPWRSDPELASAIRAFPGLRILQQPFWETLLAFLCSSNKQILQIRQMCEALARSFGTPLHGEAEIYSLPRPEQLANQPLEALLGCGLGYRGKYILATARLLAESPGLETRLREMPYEEARAMLQQFPGVGPKVADCVCLFGLGQVEAFPMDTWVIQILDELYGLGDFTPRQKRHVARLHFGPDAGLAQQYLFSWIRRSRGRRLQ